jgi:PEGA domain
VAKVYVNRRTHVLLLLSFSVGALFGCVERRYTIRTEPPGATVVVNGEEIGPSPASKSFTYYGDRKITLILDGYQTKVLNQSINAPWWDNYITEFFAENAISLSLRDEREYSYQLESAQLPPQRELHNRAEGLRDDARIPLKPRRSGILGWLGF